MPSKINNTHNTTDWNVDISPGILNKTNKGLASISEENENEIESLNEVTDESIRKFYKSKNNIQTIDCPSKRKQIIQQFHDSNLGGHQGIDKTLERIQRYYDWTNLKNSIEDYIKSCEICQKCKPSRRTNMQMQLVEDAKYPFFRLFLDVVGP